MSVDVEKRVHYFDGQFLKAEDFIAEQEYHVDRQMAHNQMLHTPGIAGGLDVTANGGATEAEVGTGMAVDAEGHQIVLAGPRNVDLRTYAGQTVLLLISYDEVQSDTAAVGDGATRWHERPRVEAVVEAGAPPANTHVRLGRVVVNASGTVTSYDDSVRISAGVQIGDELELRRLTISRSRVDPARWPALTSGAVGRADLSGSLQVDGALTVGGSFNAAGAARLGGTLNVASSADIGGPLSAGGSTTIGGDASVGRNLSVTGTASLGGDTGVTGSLGVSGALTVSGSGRFNTTLRVVGQSTLAGASLSGSLSVTGRVGIGTTSPQVYNGEANSLVVLSGSANGNGMTIASPTTGRGHLYFADGTSGSSEYRGGITYDHGTGMGGGADSLYFRTSGALQAAIDNSGNLGIGTLSPAAKLHVDSGAVHIANAGGYLMLGTESGGAYIREFTAGVPIQFNTNNAGTHGVKMTLTAAGDLGIGTANPAARLDVSGEIKARFFRAGQGNAGSVTAGNWYRVAENTGNGKRANAEFTLRDTISGGGHSTVTFRVGTSYNDAPGMSFTLLNHSRYQRTTFTRVRVLENSTYDAQYLEVFANRSGSVEYSIYDNLQTDAWVPVDWTAGAVPAGYESREYDLDQLFAVGDYQDRFAVARGGNVGIGTASPNRPLTVEGAGGTYLNVKGNGGTYEVLLGADNAGGIVSTMTNHDLQLRAGGNNTKVTIKASGDVGIGTTNPSATLHVAGDSILQQPDWQSAPVADGNGWTRYSTSYNEPAYFKDSMGVVHLRGLVKPGTGRDIFTLPVGYRPTRRELFTCPTGNTTVLRVDVLTSGRVYASAYSSNWVSLDGITFRAAPSVLFAVTPPRVLSIF